MNLGAWLSGLIQNLVGVAKHDFAADVLPLVATAAQNIARDRSPINVAAQLMNLETGLLAALPQIAQDEWKAVADAISNAVNSFQQEEAAATTAQTAAPATPAK